MDTPAQPEPTVSRDERIMAALSHVSAILYFMGLVVPVFIWLTQREKSRYAAFQALQAIVYQLIMIVVWFLGFGCYMLSIFGTMFGSLVLAEAFNRQPMMDGFPFLFPFGVLGLTFLFWIAYMLYAIIAAVLTLQGRPFRYLLLGQWVENWYNRNS